jgi:hypothetical protein
MEREFKLTRTGKGFGISRNEGDQGSWEGN